MKCLLSIGSNVGNREKQISDAIRHLESLAAIVKRSPVYESRDSNGSGKKYLNSVVEVNTEMTEKDMNQRLKEYELMMGRTNESRERGEVPIDLDIVVCNGDVVRLKDYQSSYFKYGLERMR